MVLWLPKGHVIMVDLGSTKNKGIVTKDAFKYFKDHTSFKDPHQWLEWLVLTHGDRDHYNMVEEFLKLFQVNVRNVLHGGLESDYGKLIGRLRARKNSDDTTPNIYTGRNSFFNSLGPTDTFGAEVGALATGVESTSTSVGYQKNTRSTVLRIVYKGIALMLTGDATRDTEFAILGYISGTLKKDPRGVIPSNVLKVAHHGSHRTSNHAAWISVVDPNYAFITSDRSGSLDEDQKATGHRLPQMLTVDLLRAYGQRLQKDCGPHTYVSSYQLTDYTTYNEHPDAPNQKLPIPSNPKDLEWIQSDTKEGIFSTLAVMGTSTDPFDEGANDIGVQYRITIGDNGSFDVYSTLDFSKFTKLSP
jgi:hypothetical protein